MSKQKMNHDPQVENIYITNGDESQNNRVLHTVITAFVVANAIAFSTAGGMSEKQESTSGYVAETRNMAKVVYPAVNVGIIDSKGKSENLIPQAKIKGGNILIHGEMPLEADSQSEISKLRRENGILKNRLNNSFPTHIVIYMIVNSIISSVVMTLLILRFCLNIYTINPYYLICSLIISMGLFLTASAALRDWKDVLLNGKKRK